MRQNDDDVRISKTSKREDRSATGQRFAFASVRTHDLRGFVDSAIPSFLCPGVVLSPVYSRAAVPKPTDSGFTDHWLKRTQLIYKQRLSSLVCERFLAFLQKHILLKQQKKNTNTMTHSPRRHRLAPLPRRASAGRGSRPSEAAVALRAEAWLLLGGRAVGGAEVPPRVRVRVRVRVRDRLRLG